MTQNDKKKISVMRHISGTTHHVIVIYDTLVIKSLSVALHIIHQMIFIGGTQV